jgi:hypothetical protein
VEFCLDFLIGLEGEEKLVGVDIGNLSEVFVSEE